MTSSIVSHRTYFLLHITLKNQIFPSRETDDDECDSLVAGVTGPEDTVITGHGDGEPVYDYHEENGNDNKEPTACQLPDEDQQAFDPSSWTKGNVHCQQPLYDGARFSLLAFVFMIYELKTKYKSTFPDNLLLDILQIFHKILPPGNKVPIRTSSRAKPSVTKFYDIVESFSPVEKEVIHVCKNGCVCYIGDNLKDKVSCPTCDMDRYKPCSRAT